MVKAVSVCYRHITQCHTLKDLEKVPSPKVRSIYALIKVSSDKNYGVKTFRLRSGARTRRCV